MTGAPDLGSILATLTTASQRPRYAFLVLGLIAEAARADGHAGPWVTAGRGSVSPCATGSRASCSRSPPTIAGGALKAKVTQRLGAAGDDAAEVDAALAAEALVIGKANVSRAVSDLVRAGLVRRHYAGRVTDHRNRGGGRLAVYAVEPPILRAIRSRPTLV